MNNNEYSLIIRQMIADLKDAFYKPDQSDHSYKMKVLEAIDASHYKVIYNGGERKVTSSIQLNTNDYVWVCAPCNNWNNLFVVSKTK